MNNPPNHNYIVDWLPYRSNVNPQGLEEDLTGKPQRPEYTFVAINTHKFIEWIFEDNVFSGDSAYG
jgi:hypothetical protein